MMRIALLSDTHLSPAAPAFDRNLNVVRRWVAANRIGHSIHLGDISADGVDEGEQPLHAQARLADWPGLLHVLPGNHDVGDNPGKHGHPVADAERVAGYSALLGPDRWIIRVGNWTLIGLNAQMFGRADDLERAQDAWLSEVIVGLDGPVGLCLHKPLFRTSARDGDDHHRYVPPDARGPLLDRLSPIDLRFVAAGHTHQTRMIKVDGVEHVWVPSASFTLPGGMQDTIGIKEVGVMLLTIEGDGHRFERIIPDGLAQHDLADHAYVYPAHANAIRAARHARD